MEVANPTHFHLAKRIFLQTLCLLMLSNGAIAQRPPSPCDQFKDITRTIPPGLPVEERRIKVTWPHIAATEEYNVYHSKASGDIFMLGDTLVSYAFLYRDSPFDSNTVLCSFTVSVVEDTPPITCPDGSLPSQCNPNPCTATACPANPDAQCRVNYCRGCTPEFFDHAGKPVQCVQTPPDGQCPDGTLPAQCVVNPCDTATCPGNPNNECKPNYCKGCEAVEFFDQRGNLVDCTQPGPDVCTFEGKSYGVRGSRPAGDECNTCYCNADGSWSCTVNFCEPCPDGVQPVVSCDANPCDVTRCEGNPSAFCRPNYCGGCNAEFADARGNPIECEEPDVLCPDGSDPFECTVNPCDTASCAANPNAQCRPDYCGGCNAVFYDEKRKTVNCTESDTCPDGSQPFECTVNPCDTASCAANPNAQCRPDYCGGCNAVFYDEKRRPLNCTESATCPDGSDPFECTVNPCDTAVCAAIPYAVCKPDYCGGCNAKFYIGRSPVYCDVTGCLYKGNEFEVRETRPAEDGCNTCHCMTDGSWACTEIACDVCPDGSQPSECDESACSTATCPASPNAPCRPNRCRGCVPEFYDVRGNPIDCTETDKCPDGSRPFRCLFNPCESHRCSAHPGSRCVPNYCGGCFAEFYDAERNLLDCKQGLEPCIVPVDCVMNPCDLVTECPAHPDATCEPNYCGGCTAEFFDKQRNRIDCRNETENCPNGAQPFNCAENPCDVYSCEAMPNAVCKPDYCGGCFAKFFDNNGEEIDDCSEPGGGSCPDGRLPVPCAVDPCTVSRCPSNPNARCVANYCGGCNAEYYDAAGRVDCNELTKCQRQAQAAQGQGLLGAFIPQCNATGGYEARQCHGSTGHCWCVNEDGVELVGTRRPPGQGEVICGSTGSMTCDTEPCLNGGTCQDMSAGAFCTCPPGFSGERCEQPPILGNACDPTPCQNGGECINLPADGYVCRCPSGYAGINCESEVAAPPDNENDITPPNIENCPRPIQRSVAQGISFEEITWEEPEATDQSGPVTTQHKSAVDPRTYVLVGADPTMVRYVFEDRMGNSNVCEFLVSAVYKGNEDDIPPVVANCPGDITVEAAAGERHVIVDWVEPTATDNITKQPISRVSQRPGSRFPVHRPTTTVTYKFYDAAGNEATCSFTVTITGGNVPTDSCTSSPCQNGAECFPRGNLGYYCLCTDGYTGANCDQETIDPCLSRPCLNGATCYPRGGLFVYFCQCAQGFTGVNCETPTTDFGCVLFDCQDGFICRDTLTGPECVCPPGYTGERCEIPSGSGCAVTLCPDRKICQDTASGPICVCSPGLTGDQCDTPSGGITCANVRCQNGATCQESSEGPSCECPAGYTGRLCTIPDSDEDITPPELDNSCPRYIQHVVPQGFTFEEISWDEPQAQDDRGSEQITTQYKSAVQPRMYVQVGGTARKVRYVFEDRARNAVECQFLISAIPESSPADNIPPVVANCPADITIPADAGRSSATVDWIEPIATDDSGHEPSVRRSRNPNSRFPIRDTTVTYKFYDAAGNEAVCSFIVSVIGGATPNPCENNPCLNGATCTTRGIAFICQCAQGFSGITCGQSGSDPCSNNPCQNGAPCYPRGTTYFCECPLGFTGPNCDQSSDACSNNPCQNGAPCYPRGTTYYCDCPLGFTGPNCDQTIGACATVRCGFGATCVETTTGFECVCPAGYTGDRCETPIGACATVRCGFGATCVETATGFECVCPAGYTGDQCEISSGGVTCANVRCQNGATCQESSEGPSCECPAGYTGRLCTISDNGEDITPPELDNSCPTHVQNIVPQGFGYEEISWNEPGVSDDRGSEQITTQYKSAVQPRMYVQVGGTPRNVRYVFEDRAGNAVECQFMISAILEGSPVDNIPPVVSNCPADITIPADAGRSSATVDWIEPFATDDSGNTPSVRRSRNPNSRFPIRDTTVMYKFYDAAGNEAVCSFIVSVIGGATPDPCENNPCLNGATCTTRGIAFICQCAQGFSGITCGQTSGGSDPCINNPCQNGAPCYPRGTTYFCDCPLGFTGTNCEQSSDACINNPCQNGAPCYPRGTTYYCDCPLGFTGNNCDQTAGVDFCLRLPCQNGATCTSSSTGYICNCPSGYTGVNCERGEGSQECNPNPCQNGAVCRFYAARGYVCDCPANFAGQFCETVIGGSDGCTNNPCQNGATCNPQGSQYTCACTTGFTGRNCDQSIGDGPILNCPENMVETVDSTLTFALIDWSDSVPRGKDNTWTNIFRPVSTSRFVGVGNPAVQIVYRFEDTAGSLAECRFNISARHGGGGVLNDINCPDDIIMPASQGQGAYVPVIWPEPSGTIAGKQAIIVSRSHNGNSMSVQVGGNPVTVSYELSDGNGNQATCEFTIRTEIDNLPPVVTQCPLDIRVNIAATATSGEATWRPPIATDSSGGSVSLTSNRAPNTVFNRGNTMVVYTARDAAGNVDTSCRFTVTVSTSVNGGVNNPCNSNPCTNGKQCAYHGNDYICVGPSGRKRRDADGPCESDLCSLHSTCVEMSEYTYACICDEGYEGPDCFTVALQLDLDDDISNAHEDDKEDRETTMAIVEGLSIATISTLIVLILVVAILATVICIASHRMKTKNKSIDKAAFSYKNFNEVYKVPHV